MSTDKAEFSSLDQESADSPRPITESQEMWGDADGFVRWLGLAGAIVAAPLSLLLFQYVGLLQDVVVHMAGLGLASILTLVSLLAYGRDGRLRFLFLGSAFTLFSLREAVSLLTFYEPGSVAFIEFLANHPRDHLMNLWILMLFTFGVVKQ